MGAGTCQSSSKLWPEVFTQDVCQLDFLLLHRKGTKEFSDKRDTHPVSKMGDRVGEER